MNRRDFIKQTGCAAMGSTTLLSTLTSLGAVNGAMSGNLSSPKSNEDYKALVCILFSGGMDSYNTLIPYGTTVGGDNGFNDYKSVRSDLEYLQMQTFGNLTILNVQVLEACPVIMALLEYILLCKGLVNCLILGNWLLCRI